MPAGDVFGLDGFFLNKSNPITVSAVEINSTAAGAGIAVTGGSFSSGTVTLTFDTNAVGLGTTTPFYTGAKIAVSGLSVSGVAHTGYNGNFVVTGFAGTTTVSYATTGYVGVVTTGITTTGLVMLVTDTAVTNTTWSTSQTHGWFGGLGFPGAVSTVNRIDFSNDTSTASVRSPLSVNRGLAAATGNSNYGWFGAGYSPGPTSSVDRIDFSNDSGSISVRGPLSSVKYIGPSATGNSNYGWFGGGGIPAKVSTVDRIDFANDSGTALSRGRLTASRYNAGATGNSNYGWFGGGSLPGATATVDRIDFSNDSSTASPRSLLNSARYGVSATGNSNYGWWGGGTTGLSPSNVSTVQRIDFSNDLSSTSIRGPLSGVKWATAATGNSNYGWFGGGIIPPGITSRVDRIDFSNDSVAVSVRGSLSYDTSKHAATSGQARSSSTRPQKAGNYGWWGGGCPSPQTPVFSAVDRIDFSNDSIAASPRTGTLSATRYGVAATGNSNYGWFGGGSIPSGLPAVATVDRIDFSNDSTTASIRAPLSSARSHLAATGNSNYGWFGGGQSGTNDVRSPYFSLVDRIDFSNDSATVSPRGNVLNTSRFALAATGNSNYGWFSCGSNSTTKAAAVDTVDRIDFSNDSTLASPRTGTLSAKNHLAATGNSNYGWFAGGLNTPGVLATVERMDFSNDSVLALSRGPLTLPKYVMSATGNSNYGWFGGGNIGPAPLSGTAVTTVYRINFSNDSVTTVERGGLFVARERLAATSNTPT